MGWMRYDFVCKSCKHEFDDLVYGMEGQPEECPACKVTGPFDKLISAPAVLTTIVASYPGSKRLKAGYQHTHNRAAEKKSSQVSMVGTGGVKKDGT